MSHGMSSRRKSLPEPTHGPTSIPDHIPVFPMTTTLPLEVIFNIIDVGLHNDPPTLRILSLTCHTIRSYTHKHLFRRVDLYLGEWQESNIPQFLAVIRSSPTILSAINSLKIRLGNRDGRRIAEVDALCSVMQQGLPNLTGVHLTIARRSLDRVDEMPQFPTSLSQLLGNPRLSKLMIWGDEPLDLTMLGNAKHIVDFAIQTVRSHPNHSIDNAATRSPPRLRPTAFTLYNPPFNHSALSSSYCDLTAVSTFRIFGIGPPLQVIPAYFAKFSSTLTRLEVYVKTYRKYYEPGDPPPLILSALLNLRHLTLTLDARFEDGQLASDSERDFHCIINILCSLPHSNIVESIRILTQCDTLDYLRSIDWALFDSSVFGLGTPAKWAPLKALDMVFFMPSKRDLTPLETEFQDVWLPGTLLNFREKTDAVLDVRCRTGQTIIDYATGVFFL
ncbi:hypothetical protein BJ165DRAFT_1609977 [Panaeolus papilionaceus]|nr:hypothetical protein BJ165DRAFT_1609977 [Panaeolus papilionaceus]